VGDAYARRGPHRSATAPYYFHQQKTAKSHLWRADPAALSCCLSGLKPSRAPMSFLASSFSMSQGLEAANIPDSFLCPITQEILEDPVCAADGQTYERSALEEWFRRGKRSSPLTGAPLEHINVTPNVTLRKAIQDFLEARERAAQEASSGKAFPAPNDRQGVKAWLDRDTLLSAAPPEHLDAYVEAFAKDGATCLGLLVDAEYTREDLINLGVRRPHVASMLRCIQEYR
jgi:hypothetical protein